MTTRRRRILWAGLGAVVGLGVLIYGAQVWWLVRHGASPQPIPSAILNVDQGFDFPKGFPPDPGDVGKKTIQGIDSDQDGVRDDVQRWIYAFAPKEPRKQVALRQKARYFQAALDEEFGLELRKKVNIQNQRAVQCMRKSFDDNLRGYAEDLYLKAKVLNTYRRVERYWDNNGKLTSEELGGGYPEYESPCDDR